MRNEDTPAMPTHVDSDGHYLDPKTCVRWEPHHGFTKREQVVLEFAKALVSSYSYPSEHRHQIMVTAKSLADTYFKQLELPL